MAEFLTSFPYTELTDPFAGATDVNAYVLGLPTGVIESGASDYDGLTYHYQMLDAGTNHETFWYRAKVIYHGGTVTWRIGFNYSSDIYNSHYGVMGKNVPYYRSGPYTSNNVEVQISGTYSGMRYAFLLINVGAGATIDDVEFTCFSPFNGVSLTNPSVYGHIVKNYSFDDGSGVHNYPYALLYPKNYDASGSTTYPLVIASPGNDGFRSYIAQNGLQCTFTSFSHIVMSEWYNTPEFECFVLNPLPPGGKQEGFTDYRADPPGWGDWLPDSYWPKGPKGAPDIYWHNIVPSVVNIWDGGFFQEGLKAMLESMKDEGVKVDWDRVYSTGFSYGARATWASMESLREYLAAGWPLDNPPLKDAMYEIPIDFFDVNNVRFRMEASRYKHIALRGAYTDDSQGGESYVHVFALQHNAYRNELGLPSDTIINADGLIGVSDSNFVTSTINHVSHTAGPGTEYADYDAIHWVFSRTRSESLSTLNLVSVPPDPFPDGYVGPINIDVSAMNTPLPSYPIIFQISASQTSGIQLFDNIVLAYKTENGDVISNTYGTLNAISGINYAYTEGQAILTGDESIAIIYVNTLIPPAPCWGKYMYVNASSIVGTYNGEPITNIGISGSIFINPDSVKHWVASYAQIQSYIPQGDGSHGAENYRLISATGPDVDDTLDLYTLRAGDKISILMSKLYDYDHEDYVNLVRIERFDGYDEEEGIDIWTAVSPSFGFGSTWTGSIRNYTVTKTALHRVYHKFWWSNGRMILQGDDGGVLLPPDGWSPAIIELTRILDANKTLIIDDNIISAKIKFNTTIGQSSTLILNSTNIVLYNAGSYMLWDKDGQSIILKSGSNTLVRVGDRLYALAYISSGSHTFTITWSVGGSSELAAHAAPTFRLIDGQTYKYDPNSNAWILVGPQEESGIIPTGEI